MSNKIKKSRGLPLIKKYDGKTTNKSVDLTIVPGCRWKGKPMTITFKEFRELSS